MITLRISLFGPMRVVRAEDSSEVRLTHTTQALLAYLLLKYGRFVAREELVALFWADCSERQAHDCLNTALWRLRRDFRPAQLSGVEYLTTNCQGAIGFLCADDCWLDVAEFDACWKRMREASHPSAQSDLDQLDRLTTLYQGDLLEGFGEDWIVPQRERFRLIYLNCLSRLMDHYSIENDFEKSLEYGQRILSLDPLREDVHRDMMRHYLNLGQRALAVHQYKTCCETLARELNIAPMSETQALYEVALDAPGSPYPLLRPASGPNQGSNESFQDALIRVRIAADSLEKARSALGRALQALEHTH